MTYTMKFIPQINVLLTIVYLGTFKESMAIDCIHTFIVYCFIIN